MPSASVRTAKAVKPGDLRSIRRPTSISSKLPHVAIIRPLTDKFAGAVATIASFTADGLFFGQSQEFLKILQAMAVEADAAVRFA